jgi:hypothetical protein
VMQILLDHQLKFRVYFCMQSSEFLLKDISVKRIVINIARLKLLSFIFLWCTVHFPTIHWHLGGHISSRIFN